jgi:HEAT repeat protein
VIRHYNKLALTGLPERDPGLHEVELEHIFVKLNIQLPHVMEPDEHLVGQITEELHNADELGLTQKELVQRLHRSKQQRQPITLSLAEVLSQHSQLAIIGGPGSGKTTLTRWIAVIFARREQAKPQNLGIALEADRLPIVLELRRFAEHFVMLNQQPTVPNLATEIASFISGHAYYPDTPAAFIQQALSAGRCLILLDGLDEIADLGARQLLTDAIHSFIQHPTQYYGQNLLIITSRPHGYHSISLSAVQLCEVKPFSPEDVAFFIQHWYSTAYPEQEQSEAADLTLVIQANERVGELATNPLLCTIIAIVYRNNRVLPNRRVELYLKCCEALLDTWERNKALKSSGLIARYDWQTKLELLAPVAYWLHSEAERLAASEDNFVTQLAQVLRAKNLGEPAKAEQEAREFITLIRDRSGLLQGRGDGTLEFTHRTFQEYLAARYIAIQAYPIYIDLVMAHLHEAWWREVHLLVISHLGSSSDRAPQVAVLVAQILNVYPPPHSFLQSYFPKAIGARKLRLLPGRLLPGWQWQRRLAWAQGRELEISATSCLDCMPLGLTQASVKTLQTQLLQFLLRLIYDLHYFNVIFEINDNLLSTYSVLFGSLQNRWTNISDVAIQAALQAPEADVRSAAAYTLGLMGQSSPAVSKALFPLLQDPEEIVEYTAGQAIRDLAQSSPAIIETLITALQNPEPTAQIVAARIAGQVAQNSSAVTEAILPLLQDPESTVRVAAIRALRNMRHSSLVVIEAILPLLQDPESTVRVAAIRALDQQGRESPVVIEALLIALQDPESIVRFAAARVLGDLRQSLSFVIDFLLATLQTSETIVRAEAARVLGDLRQSSPAVIEALLRLLQDPETTVRAAAVYAFGRLRPRSPFIIDTLLPFLQDSEVSVQIETARAFGDLRLSSPAVIETLLTAFQNPDARVRTAAIRALGQLGQDSPAVIEALLIALQDPEVTVRSIGARTISQLSKRLPGVVDTLLPFLQNPEVSVRAASAQALGILRLSSPAVIEALLTAFQNPDARVRTAVIRALGQLGQDSPAVIEALLIALQDPEISVRAASAHAIRELRQSSSTVTEGLLITLQDSAATVRAAAAQAFEVMEFEDLDQGRRILIALNQRLHDADDDVRCAALRASIQLVDGRPLPGYIWIPISERMARQRSVNRFSWWAGAVCALVLAALAMVYLSDLLDANSLLVRFGAAVALITGLAAGVAQVLGWTLRNPYERDIK